MIRIAFCDDQDVYLERMKELIVLELEALSLQYDIETYTSGTSLLKDYNKDIEGLDIIFLDIDMPKLDGISVAKQIREMNNQVVIVFLTMMENRVYDTFGYNAYRFILKSYGEDRIRTLFRECLKHAVGLKASYTFNTPDGILKLAEKEIIYFERNLRKFYIKSTKGTYRIIIDKFEDITEELGENHFFERPNRSVLLNLRYVYEITKKDEVVVRYHDEEEKFPLGRTRKKDFYDSFISYIR